MSVSYSESEFIDIQRNPVSQFNSIQAISYQQYNQYASDPFFEHRTVQEMAQHQWIPRNGISIFNANEKAQEKDNCEQ